MESLKFNNKIESRDNTVIFLKALSREGMILSPEMGIENSYRLIFPFNDINGSHNVTMKINFEGENKNDLVVTNITTLPETSKGYGSMALKVLISNAKGLFSKITAVQIGDIRAENFWIKNGFRKCTGENLCNDFELKI